MHITSQLEGTVCRSGFDACLAIDLARQLRLSTPVTSYQWFRFDFLSMVNVKHYWLMEDNGMPWLWRIILYIDGLRPLLANKWRV